MIKVDYYKPLYEEIQRELSNGAQVPSTMHRDIISRRGKSWGARKITFKPRPQLEVTKVWLDDFSFTGDEK